MRGKTIIDRRTFIRRSGIVGAALALGGIFPRTSKAQVKEIPIAFINPFSGPVAFAGIPGRNGAEMAFEAINASGGIRSLGGAKLRPIYYDTESKPEVGRSVAERAINDGVVAIIGCAQSAVGVLVSQVAERAGIPNLVDMGSGDFLTERGFKYVFRIMPSNTQQMESDLDFIANVGKKRGIPVKKVAILYEDTASGQDYFKLLTGAIGRYGLELVSSMGYPAGTSDVSPQVNRLKMAKPDFIIMYSWESDSILILRTMNEMGYTPPGIIGKAFTEKVIAQVGALGEYLFETAYFSHKVDPPGAPRGWNMKFYQDYVRRYGSFNPMAALSYTCVIVLANAIERAGSTNPKAIRDALASTNMTGKDGILQVVKRIQFDEKGNSIYSQSLVVQIVKKEKMVVWPSWAAEMEPIYPMPEFNKRG